MAEVELLGLFQVLALMAGIGGTVYVLLHRDRPAGAVLFGVPVGTWLALTGPHLRHLPARLHSVSAPTWTAAAAAAACLGVLMLLGGLTNRRRSGRCRKGAAS